MQVPSIDTTSIGRGIQVQPFESKNADLISHARNPRLREAAGKTVGSAFYGTVFQMMRESPFKTNIGHGGRGEEVFAAQLHGVLAERLGESRRSNLSDILYRRLERQQRLIDSGSTQRSGA